MKACRKTGLMVLSGRRSLPDCVRPLIGQAGNLSFQPDSVIQIASPRQKRSGLAMTFLFSVITILALSCSEPFPAYAPPDNVLQGEIEVIAPDTVIVFFVPPGSWFVNTPLILNVNLTNAHDDLLSGAAKVEGLVTVQSFSAIPRTMTVNLTTGNLLGPPVFQGEISVPPGGSATFSSLWTPYAIDGSIVFEGLPFVEANGRKYYGPISFLPNAEVQIFEQIQPIQFQGAEFQLLFEQRDG